MYIYKISIKNLQIIGKGNSITVNLFLNLFIFKTEKEEINTSYLPQVHGLANKQHTY